MGGSKLQSNISEFKAVFVHLGETLPEHLQLNLIRHRKLFPEIQVVLVVDHAPEMDLDDQIEVFFYIPENTTEELFLEAGKHMDHSFRAGFWKHTFNRLFALEFVHSQYPHHRILHIESDVVLMPNFPWDKLRKIEKLSWLNVNNENDIASLVYLDSLDHTKHLSSFLRKTLASNPSATDMSALRSFAIEAPLLHEYLPSVYSQNKRSELGLLIVPGERRESLGLGGYFDPLAFGIWNMGQDPKNNYGLVRRYVDQQHHDIDVRGIHLVYEENALKDQFGNLIYSLHVHSKCKELFGADWEKTLIQLLKEANLKSKPFYFDRNSFFSSIKDRRLREHLWHFMTKNKRIYDLAHSKYFSSLTSNLKRLLRI